MNRYTTTFAAALVSACGLNAQIPSAHIAESKTVWTGVKNNIQRMADAMPEENYSFKATPEIRSFGELIGHIADAQSLFCGMVTGKPKQLGAGKMTAKADLVGALKESISMCDAAFDSVTEANAAEMVGSGRNQRTKLGTLEYNTSHSNEEYGYTSVYMRLKGLVPPSTAGRGPGR